MTKFKDLCLLCSSAHQLAASTPSCLKRIVTETDEVQYKISSIEIPDPSGESDKIKIRGTCPEREEALKDFIVDADYDSKKVDDVDLEKLVDVESFAGIWDRAVSLGIPTKEELNSLEDLVIEVINKAQGKKTKGQKGYGLKVNTQKDRIAMFALFLSCYTGIEISYVYGGKPTPVYKQLTSVTNGLGKELLALCEQPVSSFKDLKVPIRLKEIKKRINAREQLEKKLREYQPHIIHLINGTYQIVMKHYSKNLIIQLDGIPFGADGVIYKDGSTRWDVINGQIDEEYKTRKNTVTIGPYKVKSGPRLLKNYSAPKFKSRWLAAIDFHGDDNE